MSTVYNYSSIKLTNPTAGVLSVIKIIVAIIKIIQFIIKVTGHRCHSCVCEKLIVLVLFIFMSSVFCSQTGSD